MYETSGTSGNRVAFFAGKPAIDAPTGREEAFRASLAGAWVAAVAGFGGMRDHDGELTFKPRLPPLLERLAFRLLFRGRRLMVDVSKRDATYTLLAGRQLQIAHYGKAIRVSRKTPVTETIPPVVERPAPSQPPSRAPVRRARQS